ncbi:MAG: hypothetical protein JOY80_05865 [Candidatus Dormibacteraeota bacterium]|nr:hypothetical protein [Candidatus Dormibacteraeota bacterium]
MTLFNRKAANGTAPAEPQVAALCQERGCDRQNAVRCGYRDRRGRYCGTLFCPDHSAVVDGVTYCRRHAGTMRALGSRGAHRAGLPDVSNRGPSLVNYIANHLDESMTALLQRAAHADEQVLGDPEVTMAFDPERNPRWERSWRLVESTGVVIKVTVFVDDRRDSNVTVRVGSEMVAEGVPPWIQHRMRGETVPDSVEQSERQLFYEFLVENVTAAVAQLRVRDDHPSWV